MKAAFDLTYLKEVSKGNDAFMLDMIDIFLHETPETLSILEDSINTANWEMVGFYAHKLKATYAYMGMLELKEELIKIEKSAKNMENIEMIPSIFNHLKEQTNPALLEISELKSTIVKN